MGPRAHAPGLTAAGLAVAASTLVDEVSPEFVGGLPLAVAAVASATAALLDACRSGAGWAGVEVLPIEHPFFSFYRLVD